MSTDYNKSGVYLKAYNFSKIKDSCEGIVDNIPVGVFRLHHTSEGLFLKVNPAFARLFGFDTIEELIKFPVVQLYGESEPQKEICEMTGSGIIYDKELSFRRKDGTPLWISGSVNAKRNENGVVEWIDGIIKDITERKKLEEKLIEAKERYQALFEHSNDAIFIFDLNGIHLDVNKKGCEILGYSRDELIGKSYKKIVAKRNHSDSEFKIELILNTDILPLYECYLQKKDGCELPVEINQTIVRDINGDPQYLQSIVRDISIRKQKELSRRELEDRRKKFFETTTHELRTPLTIIQGYIELLDKQSQGLSDDLRKGYFKTINKNIDRLTRAINEVTDLASLERKVFRLNKEITSLNPFLEEIIHSYENLLGNQIQYRNLCNLKPVYVSIDRYRFNQVIDNLISNAVKHTDKSSREIVITLKTVKNDEISITICDNGAGIVQENIEMIFESFVSIESKYSIIGSGIGLYLSKAIVEEHGGKIYATSKGLDQGSTFIIELPIITKDLIQSS